MFPKIFPKTATAAYKAKFTDLLETIDAVNADQSSSPEQKQALLKSKIDLLPILEGDSTGLRVDITLLDPITGESKWLDISAVHTNSPSYISKEIKAVLHRQVSSSFAEE